MLFNLSKYYLKGAKKDTEETVTMKFNSQEAAEAWAHKMSQDIKVPYIINQVLRVSKFSK